MKDESRTGRSWHVVPHGELSRPPGPQVVATASKVIGAAAFLLGVQPSLAQTWRIEPSLQASTLVTNNSLVGTTSPPEKDIVIALTPGVRITGRGARVKVDGDLALELVDYVKGTLDNRAFARGRLGASAELIEHWLHLDTSIASDQSAADPFSLKQGDTVTSQDLTTIRYRVSPYVERQLNSSVSFLARSDTLWTRRSGDATAGLTRKDSQVQQNVVRIERRPIPLGLSLELSSQRSKYPDDVEAALDLEALRATASYAPTPELVVGVISGRERSRFALSNATDSIYGASLAWRPSERTDLSGKVEHRFFGWGGSAEARHRSPFLALSIRLERAPIAQPSSLLLVPADGNIAALLDAAFTTRYPNPAERDTIVRNLIASRGLPSSLSGPIDIFPDYVQLRQLATVSASFIGRSTTVSVSMFGGKATQLLRADEPYIPSPATDSDNRQYGLTIDFNRRISAVTTLTAQATKSRIGGIGSRAGDSSNETLLTLGANHALSPRTSVAVGVRRRLFGSTVDAASQESAAFLGANHRF